VTAISFRSQQAETGSSGRKDGRNITAICEATAALVRTGAELNPIGVIGQ